MEKEIDAYNAIRRKEDNILAVIPFNSKRKRACTAVGHPDDQNKVRVFLKGAPEIVMDYCTKYFDSNGNEVELTEEKKTQILDGSVAEFAKAAYRTLLIAYTDYTYDKYE